MIATFAGGCFWCLEAVFTRIPGVIRVASGYSGGHTTSPTYREVCSGHTGHAEAVQIEYNPQLISYDKLLDIFFAAHDPTTLNRQGNDVGTQYRSAVFYHDEAQKQATQQAIATLQPQLSDPIVTEVVPLSVFYPAEIDHKGYYDAHPEQPYCAMVIAPKLRKLGL